MHYLMRLSAKEHGRIWGLRALVSRWRNNKNCLLSVFVVSWEFKMILQSLLGDNFLGS